MKRTLLLLLFDLLASLAHYTAWGQNDLKHKGTKFNFTQRDSIVKIYKETLGKDSFFIAHSIFNAGSHVRKKEFYYENPFEILFYYKQNGEYYTMRVNNFGISNPKRYKSNSLISFLNDNIAKMELEELQFDKKDTIDRKKYELENGKIKESYTIRITGTTDHQRFDRVWINYKNKAIQYYFPSECVEIKSNLLKKQYLFLILLQKATNKTRKKLKIVEAL